MVQYMGSFAALMALSCLSGVLHTSPVSRFPSKIHDGRVLTLSNIPKCLPSLCDGGRNHTLGDAACREYLITPYKDYGNPTEVQSTFNTKLSATQVLIEKTFGILKQTLRQLKDVEFFSPERMCQLIMSCCVVHNLYIDADDLMEESLQESQEDLEPGDGDMGEEQTALHTLGELTHQWLVNMEAQ
ncbi:putative nuclease HARBI1 [Ornithodoros turicata]|uniref:putative nuclease HARBI1 n=1 Tax=Ornithodoros turicata TaxID=34597 RepID=UPI0031395DB8